MFEDKRYAYNLYRIQTKNRPINLPTQILTENN